MFSLTADDVIEKLDFAHRRQTDLLALIHANRLGTELHERQQLIQEFFFHLIGAVDLLAQLVNERRALGIDFEEVNITCVVGRLNRLQPSDPLAGALRCLYVNPKKQPLPPDPYSDAGYLYRAYNYRHQVTHRRRNPFTFLGGPPLKASFTLDPRDAAKGVSTQTVDQDLDAMFNLIASRCRAALALC